MNRRHFLLSAGALATIVALPALAASPPTELQVFKSPNCGCCGAWVEHMRAAGFSVKVTEVDDTTAARKRLGLPDRLGSCHTATVAGYVLEGQLTLWLGEDEESATLYPGDVFQVPSYARLRYANQGDTPARVLWIYT